MIGLDCCKGGLGSVYEAFGRVAIVVWIYCSAQIFFFGAQFIRVHAEVCGMKGQAAAERDAVQTPSEAAMKPPPVVQTGEPLMRMAARVGSTSLVSTPLPPARAQVPPPVAAVLSEATTASAPIIRLRETPNLVVTAIPAKPTLRATPRLLLAAAIGFVFGRMFGPTGTNKRKSNRAVQ